MECSQKLLNLVLDSFSEIKDIVSDTDDIIKCTKEITASESILTDVLEKSKILVDKLYEHSDNLKKSFHKHYNQFHKDNCEKDNEVDSAEKEHMNISRTSESYSDTTSDNSNHSRAIEDDDENDDNNQTEDRITTEVEDPNDTSLKKKISIKTEDCDAQEAPKSLIRVVDLSKLIEPKPKKTVKFDSSVIILTSSDEDSSSPPKRKNSSPEQQCELRSALKNSPKNGNKAIGTSERESNSEISSGSDGKSKKQAKNSSGEIGSKRKRRNIKKTSESEKENSNSDSDSNNTNKTKTQVQKSQKEKSISDSDDEIIKNDMNETNSKDSNDSDEGNEQSRGKSDSDIEVASRISDRLKSKSKQLLHKREKLKTIFRRNSDKSFSIAEDSGKPNNETFTKKISRKEDKMEVLSDTTSSDSEDISERKEAKITTKQTIQKRIERNIVDNKKEDKFGRKVYVPLPLIECKKLKEVYMRNKEILEIRSLAHLESLKRPKRSRRRDSKSSSDSELPKTKKIRRKTADEDNVDSSNEKDDDESDEEPLANKINLAENTTKSVDNVDDDEILADIILEQSKAASDDEITKNSSDRDNKKSKRDSKTSHNEKDTLVDSVEKDASTEETSKARIEEDTNTSGNENEKSNEEKSDDDESEKKSNNENNERQKTKRKTDDEECESQEGQEKTGKADWKKDKLLTEKLDSSDSDEEFSKFCSKKDKSRSEIIRKARKRIVVDSDDSDDKKKKNKKDNSDSSSDNNKKSSSSSDSEKDEKKEEVKKKPRRRVRRTKDSSSSEDEKSTRKHIRRVLDKDSLSETTKQAEAAEKERKARIAEKQKKYNCYFEEKMDATIDKLVLEYDDKTKEEQVTVHKKIAKKLKPHQANGIQFMWDACFESIQRAKKTTGSGCILAHCMGLGKTLQVIALIHTLLKHDEITKVNKVMVVCPLSTVLNWKNEFKKWIPNNDEVGVYELITAKKNYEKQYVVKEWHEEGGVLIIGYQMFRNLSNPDNKRISKKTRMIFYEGMVDPGPDLVICDEGHLLKNEKTSLSIAMNRIKTARRIVLTGTPLQNNLKEYWCMVQFIKPNLLGTYKEYLNRFVNPIINGQYTDSTSHDILLMRKRSHVLHKLLDGVVQRRDYSVLEPYLPPKYEYVLFVTLTETQVKLYKHYMDRYARRNDGSNRISFLFADFQQLQRICTHPRVLKDKSSEKREKEFDESDSEGSLKDFIDDGNATSEESAKSTESDSSDSENSNQVNDKKKSSQKVRVTRAQAAQRRDNNEDSDPELVELKKEWWQDYCDGDELDNINNSNKLFLFFEILKECEEIGDKILVFSQSLYTLNCIEYFLEKIDEATQAGTTEGIGGHKGSWSLGLDYFRLDGSSSSENRSSWCDTFNNPDNLRSRLFLISTKAGGLGINLVAANRVIIFDVSWNPSHDLQSIYRVYRFGQTKPSYVYRFVTHGTMEMKIYERQVTKQAISKRVIDEQQIDRHYNQNDLQELYKCDLEPTDRPIPLVPKDVLLGELLQKYEKQIYKYHLHQSLLENKEAEGLNEDERKAAWEEFENEKVIRKYNYNTIAPNTNINMSAGMIAGALTNIVRKDNPTWSEVQIKGIIPALAQQLQVQLNESDTTMYNRVLQEIQLMNMERTREQLYQNQMMNMIQYQQNQHLRTGNLGVNPARLAQFLTSRPSTTGGPSSSNPNSRPTEVIELND